MTMPHCRRRAASPIPTPFPLSFSLLCLILFGLSDDYPPAAASVVAPTTGDPKTIDAIKSSGARVARARNVLLPFFSAAEVMHRSWQLPVPLERAVGASTQIERTQQRQPKCDRKAGGGHTIPG